MEREPENDFLTRIAAPARRALEREGITSLQQLTQYSEAELLKLHGVGPSTLPKLREVLDQAGLAFKPPT